MMRPLDNRGDTILEVLISVAVVGLMLVSVATLTNRSLLTTRQAQENGEAQKIAETQLELFREKYRDPSNTFISGSYYCVRQGGAYNLEGPFSDPNNPPSNCRNGNLGYKTTVRFEDKGSGRGIFTADVKWDGIKGGTDSVGMTLGVYR